MSLLESLARWWRRPSARDRVLATLYIGEHSNAPEMQGLHIRDRARVSNVYAALHRLQDEGLVTSRPEPSLTVYTATGRPLERRMYQLTAEGRRRAEQVPPW